MGLSKLHPQAKVGFSNKPHLEVYYWPFVRSDGTAGIQSRVKIPDGVTVVALDENTHQVYIVRVGREWLEGSITPPELPGGGIEPGSTPLETARCELLEEAGVVAVNEDEDWIPLFGPHGMHPIDGLVLTNNHAYLLLRGKQIKSPEVGETKEVVTMPLSQLLELDENNGFSDPLSPYKIRRAEAWLRRHRPDLLT